MQKEIRTFVAIKIHPEKRLLEQVESFKSAFKDERINWVNEASFHLTLRFIGKTTPEQLNELEDRFEDLAENIKSFSMVIKGTGYFKSKGKPRVLFVKITETEALSELHAALEEQVVASGFHRELKPFRPHLTLGRIKHLESRLRFCSIVDQLDTVEYHQVEVSEFILYQSILKPEGPVYKTIKTFQLK